MVIAGPTGSGKSGLAVRLALEYDGEVVNCDSLQIYKGFDIGTAKTPVSERASIPHYLIDVREASQVYSAGEYARDARAAIAGISARGKLPIVVGGTGFYLRALLDGLPALPARDEKLRARLMAREEKRPGSLHPLLSRLDPSAAARIHARDVQKTIRAIEVRMLTRGAMPAASESEPLVGYRVLKIGLDPDRAELQSILNARTREMFERGLIEEARSLVGPLAGTRGSVGGISTCAGASESQRPGSGLTGGEKPFESLGYKQALAHIRGEMTVEEAIASTQIETRQYAKRQWTWFRRDPEIIWLRGFGHSPSVIEHARDMVARYVRG